MILVSTCACSPARMVTLADWASNRYRFPRLILRWLKDHVTVAATPFDHTGVVAPAADGFSAREERFRNCCRVRTASWPCGLAGRRLRGRRWWRRVILHSLTISKD